MPTIPPVVVATGLAGATAVIAGLAYLKQLGEDAAVIAAQNGITDPREVDTFRHAYTSAELTRRTGSEGLVNYLGDMNEIGSLPNWINGISGVRDRNADLLNNQSGREIGKTSTSQQDSIDKC